MICLPLKKKLYHPKIIFGPNFGPLNNILVPFNQKEKVQQKEFHPSNFSERFRST